MFSHIDFRLFENAVYPWSVKHQHPSAGGFMAPTWAMEKYMHMLIDDHGRALKEWQSRDKAKRTKRLVMS